MTNRDNIIYYTITAVVFVGIVVCSLLLHNSEQPITTGGSTNEEKQSMVEILAPYAAIISSVAALIGAGAAVYVGTRKTRRDKIDDLKLEVLEIVSTVKGHEDWVKAMDLSENKGRAGIVKIMDLTYLLGKNYQKQRWYKLLPVALAELRNEGYHELLGLLATAKVSYQPHKIIVGSPTN